MSELEKAESLLNEENAEDSLLLLNKTIEEGGEQIESLILRAKIYYKLQQWGDCLNDLNKVLETEPQHSVALNYKQMVKNIIGFWNKDSYNP